MFIPWLKGTLLDQCARRAKFSAFFFRLNLYLDVAEAVIGPFLLFVNVIVFVYTHTIVFMRLIASSLSIASSEHSTSVAQQDDTAHRPDSFHSPPTVRQTNNFYPSYPMHPAVVDRSMPPLDDTVDYRPPHITPASSFVKDEADDRPMSLFGDVPEAKRRKFILVDDNQRGTRVRVRVMLDNVKMEDMPDSHLRNNSVFPHSYFPRQMCSPPGTPTHPNRWDDNEDYGELVSGNPIRSKTFVRVPTSDGNHAELAVPGMTKGRRAKECALNELGYRMSWSQAKTFSGRAIFMQRSRA